MELTSQTPEGLPRCPVCGEAPLLALSGGGALCKICGLTLGWFRQRLGEQVELQSLFVQDLGMDSLDAVELAMAMENELGVTIPDDELRKAKTVEDLIRLVNRHLGRDGPS
jgi:acyl carrier protein